MPRKRFNVKKALEGATELERLQAENRVLKMALKAVIRRAEQEYYILTDGQLTLEHLYEFSLGRSVLKLIEEIEAKSLTLKKRERRQVAESS